MPNIPEFVDALDSCGEGLAGKDDIILIKGNKRSREWGKQDTDKSVQVYTYSILPFLFSLPYLYSQALNPASIASRINQSEACHWSLASRVGWLHTRKECKYKVSEWFNKSSNCNISQWNNGSANLTKLLPQCFYAEYAIMSKYKSLSRART